MKWQVRKIRGGWWSVQCSLHPGECRCKWFDSWRDAIRYAVWHATGQQEPLS